MYTEINFKTIKEIKEAIAAGKQLRVLPCLHRLVPVNGTVFLEGPHYPQPHKWYAQGTMKDGVLVGVK
jgi:hypothetical protein